MKVFIIVHQKTRIIHGCFKKKHKAEKYLQGNCAFLIQKLKVEK